MLVKGLELCSVKKSKGQRTSSLAYSKSGKKYLAGIIETDTHLLNYTSEQNAIVLGTIQKDYSINKVVTMVEDSTSQTFLSPLVVKFLIDYSIRSSTKIEYEILNTTGKRLFHTKNVAEVFPLYKPARVDLKMVKENKKPKTNKVKIKSGENAEEILKKYAIEGVARNFPMYDSASGYGTAILTKNGTIYFGGQYTSPDHRNGYHSEISVIMSAIMDGNTEITHLGLVSTKFADEPCDCCGICRQFIAEISARYNLDIKIINFAKDKNIKKENNINTYLPSQWTNKK